MLSKHAHSLPWTTAFIFSPLSSWEEGSHEPWGSFLWAWLGVCYSCYIVSLELTVCSPPQIHLPWCHTDNLKATRRGRGYWHKGTRERKNYTHVRPPPHPREARYQPTTEYSSWIFMDGSITYFCALDTAFTSNEIISEPQFLELRVWNTQYTILNFQVCPNIPIFPETINSWRAGDNIIGIYICPSNLRSRQHKQILDKLWLNEEQT